MRNIRTKDGFRERMITGSFTGETDAGGIVMKEQLQKKGRPILSLLLVAAMIAELAVAGFKYPGFLVKKPGPDGSKPDPVQTETSRPDSAEKDPSQTKNGGTDPSDPENGQPDPSQTENGQTDPETRPAAGGIYLTKDIPLRYTKEQLDSAPEERAAVPDDGSEAELGGIGIRMHSWNLEDPKDELIVKTLPELSEGEEGWTIRGWDISLSSGQHEFPTCAELVIPREEGEVLGSIVWFNEETDCWEDLYSEISEDGKSYIAYTDHFTDIAKKSYHYDEKQHALVEDGTGAPAVSLQDGVFVVIPDRNAGSELEYKVAIDWHLLWNQYKKKNMDEGETQAYLEQLTGFLKGGVIPKKYDLGKAAGFGSFLQGYFGAAANALETLGGHELVFKGVTEETARSIAKRWIYLDMALTFIKIEEEARKGKDVYTMFRNLPAVMMDHTRDLAGLAISGTAAIYCTGWVGALIGLLWFSGCEIYDYMEKIRIQEDRTGKYVTLDRLYDDYYGAVFSTYGSDEGLDYGSGAKRKPSAAHAYIMMKNPQIKNVLDPEDFKKLQAVLAPAVLGSWYPLATKHRYLSNNEIRIDFSYGWTKAFRFLIETCGDDPDTLSAALEALFYDYANAFWKLNDTQKASYVRYFNKLNSFTDDKAGKNVLELLEAPKGSERSRITQAYVEKLTTASREMLVSAIKTYQAKLCAELQKETEEELLPILNTKLVFHVKDPALKDGESFDRSIYSVDWRTIKENEEYLYEGPLGQKGLSFEDKTFLTPMRFGGDPKPLFLPVLPAGEEYIYWKRDAYDYYADNPWFLPQPRKGSDVVFTCTYYHYLMMGEPEEIIFRDVRDAEAYPKAAGVSGGIAIPEFRGRKTVDIMVEIAKEAPAPYKGGDLVLVAPFWINADLGLRPAAFSGSVSRYFRDLTRQAFRETRISQNKNGSFRAEVSRSFSGDFIRTDSLSGKELKTNAAVDFSLMLNGTFDPGTGTGDVNLSAVFSLRSDDVSESAGFSGKASLVCPYGDLPKHNIDFADHTADEMDLAYFDAVKDEAIAVIFDTTDADQPLKVSSDNPNLAYTQIIFVLVPDR